MKKINKILKQLSDLYEFNRRIMGYEVKAKELTAKRLGRHVDDHLSPQPQKDDEKSK